MKEEASVVDKTKKKNSINHDIPTLCKSLHNDGQGVLLGYGKIPQSRLVSKLKRGDRNIYKEYVTFRCWNGKVIPSIELRRKVEFLLLYEK